jgi:RNA polymerase sigma-70 factor (ECF subfamily)
MSDMELLMQVQGHNRGALEELYDRYSAKALGLAFKILRDRDLAEEVVVDAFWRVWQRADQFQTGRGSFASWFYGIVRHLAIDELRRRDARPAPGTDEQLEMAYAADATREDDVTEIVERSLNAELVQSALNALPPAQREVIRLAYMEGLTRKEISQQLGQPLGTIHTRARLGLDKLRGLLAPMQLGM